MSTVLPSIEVPLSTLPSSALADSSLAERLHPLLGQVFKPGRYLGLEQGAFRKPWESVKARMLLTFPDVYEIGASSYAIKLLYSVVNNHPDYLCDRVYAPAEDFRKLLAEHQLPLYGVESKQPMSAFDFVAVSLQYELNYTTVLGVLEAGQLPLHAAERTEEHPLVLAGGPGTSNPMPMQPFFDGFMVGDGEELLLELMDVLAKARAEGWSRAEKLKAVAELDGVYVPGYNEGASKRIVDLATQKVKIAPLIPAVEAIHDRVTVEARRGCDRMCRFCQPAFINLPAREKDIPAIQAEAMERLQETGYEECSLLSLSIADYSQFKPLVQAVAGTMKESGASLSLSSQRADRFSLEVAEAVQTVRKSTLTFAPEAGTARLRDVINKNLSDQDIHNAVTSAFKGGWNKVKLYYMIGLPTETQADLDGIVNTLKSLRKACQAISRSQAKSKQKHLEVNVTLSNFVPKPHTPFQWHAQDSMEQLNEKIAYLREQLKKVKGVKANFTDPEISKLEAVISKGGPELAPILEAAYRKGAYLDAWTETRPFAKWFEALEEAGIDPEAYTRERLLDPKDELPWDPIDVGLDKAWLTTEWERSLKAASTTPCFEACSVCGVCSSFNVWPNFTSGSLSELTEAEALADEAVADLEANELDERLVASAQQQALTREARLFAEKPEALRQAPVQRWRFRVKKAGSLRFVSHLDWLRLVQRAVRRTGLPLAYSQGFNPKPKISFGPSLPLLSEGLNEAFDLYLREPISLSEADLLARLNEFLPGEASAHRVYALPLEAPSIDLALRRCDYSVRWTCANTQSSRMIEERLAWLQNQPTLPVTVPTKRGTQTLDLKASIVALQFHPNENRLSFTLQPQALPSEAEGSAVQLRWIKPLWVLEALWPSADSPLTSLSSLSEAPSLQALPAPAWQITRTELYLASDVLLASTETP